MRPKNEFAADVLRASIMVTPGVAKKFQPDEVNGAFGRHLNLDWQDMDPEDRRLNLRAAMERAGRVLSAYRIRAKANEVCDLWVITEADRSATTILLPDEY
jgi:hypothetical protein